MRLRHAGLVALLLFVAAACSSHRRSLFLVGGIQVNEPILDRWISTLHHADLDTVSVTVYAKQGDWDSERLWSDAELEPVQREIAAAHRAGLRVVLILRVALDHAFEANRFLWHGMIAPKTETQLSTWFENYGAFVARWAHVAESEGVAVLGIGSELNRLTATRALETPPPLETWYLDRDAQSDFRSRVLAHEDRIDLSVRAALGGGHFESLEAFLDARSARWRSWAEQTAYLSSEDPIATLNRRRARLEEHWRRLIEQVRGIYSGRLTYAANFDHYQEVGFWDALDLVGINAYFSLREAPAMNGPLATRLRSAWQQVFDEIGTFRRVEKLEHPVLFTELGYTRRRHSTLHPWAQDGFALFGDQLVVWTEEPSEPTERAAALTALRNVAVCDHIDWFAGLLYWKLSSWPDQQAVEPFAIVLDAQDPAEEALAAFRHRAARCPQDGSQSSTLLPSGSGPFKASMPAFESWARSPSGSSTR